MKQVVRDLATPVVVVVREESKPLSFALDQV